MSQMKNEINLHQKSQGKRQRDKKVFCRYRTSLEHLVANITSVSDFPPMCLVGKESQLTTMEHSRRKYRCKVPLQLPGRHTN